MIIDTVMLKSSKIIININEYNNYFNEKFYDKYYHIINNNNKYFNISNNYLSIKKSYFDYVDEISLLLL